MLKEADTIFSKMKLFAGVSGSPINFLIILAKTRHFRIIANGLSDEFLMNTKKASMLSNERSYELISVSFVKRNHFLRVYFFSLHVLSL